MDVAVSKTAHLYPEEPPFHPDTSYPEYAFQECSVRPNGVYAAVRENFQLLGFDSARFGSRDWNPLGHIVMPGDTVFVKPNFVDHRHRYDGDLWSVITHPSVIRAVCDFVAIALKGKGRIIIGDNPHTDAKFDIIRTKCHLDQIARLYSSGSLTCEIVDLRLWHVPDLAHYGFPEGRVALAGDPLGISTLDVGKESLLRKRSFFLYRGTYTKRLETIRHHIGTRHRYVFSNSILNADVYISIPKLKSHAKVGATLNIKGLIGTIAEKNTLVHWCIGFPRFGGDEYPSPERIRDYFKLYLQHLLLDVIPGKLYFALRNYLNKTRIGRFYNTIIETDLQKEKMLRGAWEGNDTIWRMTVDVFNAFIMDATKFRHNRGQLQRHFCVVDGIIGGDADGPHFPEKVESRVIVSGEDLVAVDAVCVRLMDYDIGCIRYLKYLLEKNNIRLADIAVRSHQIAADDFFNRSRIYLSFRPPHRWPGLSLHDSLPDRSSHPSEQTPAAGRALKSIP